MFAPIRPGFPTELTTSRSSSASLMLSAAPCPRVVATSRRNAAISGAATCLNIEPSASPDSSCWLSMSTVFGRSRGLPNSSKLLNSAQFASYNSRRLPSSSSYRRPDTQSYTSLDVLVLLQTIMKHGGTSMSACFQLASTAS